MEPEPDQDPERTGPPTGIRARALPGPMTGLSPPFRPSRFRPSRFRPSRFRPSRFRPSRFRWFHRCLGCRRR